MTPRALPAISWTGLIFVLCLAPQSWLGTVGQAGEPSWLDQLFGVIPTDKVLHSGMFAVFALLWRWSGASRARILAGGLAVAVLSELGQSIPGLDRSSDLADLLADLAGLGLALAICPPRRTPARDPVPDPAESPEPGRV
ncbi:VanZ family protein [Tautonia plasticadhaerens]|uniref:VanZ like family protein n=1 Tax=Tautonia plasticadhaerens TaxID=2527974 RepID=A0A518GV58_9BACT|nr:hypothetical protein [Tautonia plasticadhaerens]QDV32472.1 hypothetical protein ElP_03050 [Tautonia plasticadhaerens]